MSKHPNGCDESITVIISSVYGQQQRAHLLRQVPSTLCRFLSVVSRLTVDAAALYYFFHYIETSPVRLMELFVFSKSLSNVFVICIKPQWILLEL